MLSNASLAGCPRLAGGLRLERAATHPVLAGARGAVRINSSAAAVLALCDGTHATEAIVSAIVSGRAGSQHEGVAADVRAFVDAARRRGWVEAA